MCAKIRITWTSISERYQETADNVRGNNSFFFAWKLVMGKFAHSARQSYFLI